MCRKGRRGSARRGNWYNWTQKSQPSIGDLLFAQATGDPRFGWEMSKYEQRSPVTLGYSERRNRNLVY